jgi:hypothetical protein
MKFFVGLFLTICVITLGIFLITPSTQGQKEQKDDATPVTRGQVTEKEKAYSKEYKKIYADREGNKLGEASKIGNKRGWTKEIGVSIGIPSVPSLMNQPEISAWDFLQNLGCNADAVVVGTAISNSSHMLDDETFVYTEYEFQVSEILKNNSVSSIEVDKNVQITRPGGFIKLDNQLIRVTNQSYETLQLKKSYLLFLKYVPGADGYIVSDSKGDFSLENNSFRSLSKQSLPNDLKNGRNRDELINNTRNAVLGGCKS